MKGRNKMKHSTMKIMLLSLLSVMAAAASSPTFRVYCELDKTSYAVNDTVTAKIYVQRTDASDDYALYNFTDRVVFYTVLLAYESGETGPADFRLDSGSNGNGTYWNERCSYISIRYQYLASGTPDNRAATLLAATLRFKVKANCQTTLGHDEIITAGHPLPLAYQVMIASRGEMMVSPSYQGI